MTTSGIQITSTNPPAAATPAAVVHDHAFSFHDFLSAINPLQYLPVVGTIYRAVTGEVIPEPLREGGSLLVSALLGGPIGLISNIVATIAEKITGIDPEKIAVAVLNPAGPVVSPAGPVVAAGVKKPTSEPVKAIAPALEKLAPASPQVALTSEQLAAYGVRTTPSGAMKLGKLEGADVLNALQLARLSGAAAAYAANQTLPLPVAARGG
jgi:hypothetical protein